MTLAEFAERWLEHEQSRLRPLTHDRYKRLMEREILPVIGRVRLSKLRPAHVQQVLDHISKKGAAPRTVLQARAVLGSAVSTAVAWGLMTVNPVRSVKPPRIERARLVIPTGDQLRSLIAAARGTSGRRRSSWPRRRACAGPKCWACGGPTSISGRVGCG